MGEGSGGDNIYDPVDTFRESVLKATLVAMKATNKIPLVKLDKQIANLQSYLDVKVLDTHYTFSTLTEKSSIPIIAKTKKTVQ